MNIGRADPPGTHRGMTTAGKFDEYIRRAESISRTRPYGGHDAGFVAVHFERTLGATGKSLDAKFGDHCEKEDKHVISSIRGAVRR